MGYAVTQFRDISMFTVNTEDDVINCKLQGYRALCRDYKVGSLDNHDHYDPMFFEYLIF